jgi:hypothetical protein
VDGLIHCGSADRTGSLSYWKWGASIMSVNVVTDWTLYQRCPVCKADAGAPCESTMFATTKGRPVYLDTPHTRRKHKRATGDDGKEKETRI